MSCCCPHFRPNWIERHGLFSSPRTTFWCNFIVYLLFLGLSTYLIARTDEGQFDFRNVLVNQVVVVDDPGQNLRQPVNFEGIQDLDTFWRWANKVLGEQIFVDSATSNLPTLIGNVFIRQFRVKETPCVRNPAKSCYGELFLDGSNWEKGGSWQDAKWDTTTGYPIETTVLPSGGYTYVLPPNQTRVQDMLTNIQNSSWIDKQTRAVVVEFVLYNSNVGYYGLTTMVVQWSGYGGMSLLYYFNILPIGVFQGNDFYVTHDMVMLFCLGYLVQEIYEVLTSKESLLKYMSHLSNWFDFLLFFLFLVVNSLYYMYRLADNFDPYAQDFGSLYPLWSLYTTQSCLEAFFLMGLYLRIVYFLRVFKHAGSLMVITANLFRDMFLFALMCVIVVAGTAITMDVVLRDEYDAYQNFGESFTTLSYAALGRGDFLESNTGGLSISQFIGNLVLFCFLMFVTILLINLLIAIMNNTFDGWKEASTGLWALQFTELLNRCESICFPPPLNLFAFIVYALALNICPHKLYSIRRRSSAFETHYDSLLLSDKEDKIRIRESDKKDAIERHIERNFSNEENLPIQTKVDSKVAIWIINPSGGKQDIYSVLEESNEEKYAELEFGIIKNQFSFPVDVYVMNGSHRVWYITMLPNSNFMAPLPIFYLEWTAYKTGGLQSYLFFFCIAENDEHATPISCPQRHEEKKLNLCYSKDYEKPSKCSSCGRLQNDLFLRCDGKQIKISYYPNNDKSSKIDCNFCFCLNCYYLTQVNISVRMAAKQNLYLVKGERWFAKETKGKSHDVIQNPLVKVIVARYLKLQKREKKHKDKEEKKEKDHDDDSLHDFDCGSSDHIQAMYDPSSKSEKYIVNL